MDRQASPQQYEDLLAILFKKQFGSDPWDSVENIQKFNMFKQQFNKLSQMNSKPRIPNQDNRMIGQHNKQRFAFPNSAIPPQNYLSNMPTNQTGRPNPKSSPFL